VDYGTVSQTLRWGDQFVAMALLVVALGAHSGGPVAVGVRNKIADALLEAVTISQSVVVDHGA
jgi:hypothetical protein